MKKRRKLAALLLAAAVSMTFGACGSSGSGKAGNDAAGAKGTADVMSSVQKNMEDISSVNAKAVMEMEMEMDISAGGQSQPLQMVTNMDMTCLYNPARVKAEVSMDMGDTGSTSMQMYIEEEDGGTCTMYMSSDGTNWQKQSMDLGSAAQYDAAASINNYLKDEYKFEETGEENVEGVDTYKYEGAITGDGLKEAMLASGALNSLSSLGLDSSQMEAMMEGLDELPITFWIDQATLYPVKYEMDMTSVMNTLMSNMMKAAGDDAEGAEVNVSKVKMSMTCSDYNKAEEFSIPEEVKSAS